MNITKLLQNACKGVRESASCIVVHKLNSLCHHHTHDYRLLFVKRHAKMKSWPGAMTFPGGVIDRVDMDDNFSPISELDKFDRHSSSYSSVEKVYRRTALRELSEETDFPISDNVETLIPWSIWQTPLSIKNRFNAIFYLLFVNSNTFELSPQEGEIESIHWLSPTEALKDTSLTFAPPQMNDIYKFTNFRTYDDLLSFAKYRYRNHRTVQLMPVLVKFSDGVCAILPPDSFYEHAVKLQLQDTSDMVKMCCTIQENSSRQKDLYRSGVDKSGEWRITTNVSVLEDGHRLPNTS